MSVVVDPLQTEAVAGPERTGVELTVRTCVADWPLYVYVMLCVPEPATVGLNVLPVTPGPLYVPPAGAPPESVIELPLEQTGLNGCNVTELPPLPMTMFQVMVYVGNTVLDMDVVSLAVIESVCVPTASAAAFTV